jgi:hypothetical protein
LFALRAGEPHRTRAMAFEAAQTEAGAPGPRARAANCPASRSPFGHRTRMTVSLWATGAALTGRSLV